MRAVYGDNGAGSRPDSTTTANRSTRAAKVATQRTWTGWRWTILLRVVEQELSRPERLIELLEAGWSQTAETRSSARTSELTTKQKRLQQEKERMLWLVIRRPPYCTSRRTFTAWARKVYLAWLWLGYEKGLLRPSGASQARPIILVLSLKDGHFSCRGVAQPGSAPALGAGGRAFKSPRPDQKNQPHTRKASPKAG